MRGRPNAWLELDAPVVGVGRDAVLDVLDGVVELLGVGAALVARGQLDDLVAAGDVAHRGDDDGRAAGADFGEGLKFLEGDRAGLDGHPEVGGELLEGVVRHGRKDGGGVRRDVRAVRLDAEEVGGRELLDELVALGVEVEFDGEAGVLGRLVGVEAGGVVAGDLDVADALRGGAVVVVVDCRGDGLEAALVVGADRHDHDEEGVFVGRGDADLRAGADEERADVEGAAGAVGRDVVEVVVHDALEGDTLMYGLLSVVTSDIFIGSTSPFLL